MNEADAIGVVVRRLSGPESIPVQLRSREGFDEEGFVELVAAIEHLTAAWRDRNDVPKVVAAAFVDLTSVIDSSSGWYSDEENERIESACFSLQELALALFAKPGD